MSILDTTRICPDCAVNPGTEHEPGCDWARCLHTGEQRLGHEIAEEDIASGEADPPDHDCGRDVWTGEFPGTAEARRFGWWVYWGPDYGKTSVFVPCTEDHPGALPDTTRIYTSCRWDRVTHRWEPR